MSPIRLSLLDVALMAAIVIILTSYAIFLIKLKTPIDNKSTTKKHTEKKGKKSSQTKRVEKAETPAETKKITNEESTSVVETKKIPEEPTESIQTEAHTETEENQKKKEDKDRKKSFFLFGKKSFEGCPHKFGHLRSLPKNTPIPDECFGCPQILECLMPSKKKK